MNPWQKFILETLAGFETPTTNETKSPDTGYLPPQSSKNFSNPFFWSAIEER
jgi:hypothetical protein